MNQEHDHILRMIEEGKISADEANQLLEAIEDVEAQPLSAGSTLPPPALSPADRRPGAWQVPTAAGALLVILGFFGSLRSRRGPGRVGAGLALITGVVALLGGLWSRSALWLHIRVQEQDGDRIRISFPLPLGLAEWGLGMARQYAGEEVAEQVEVASAFLEAVRRGEREPFLIEVNEGDGDQVLIYLG